MAPATAREQAQEPQGPRKPSEKLGEVAVPTGTGRKPPPHEDDETIGDEDDADYGAPPSWFGNLTGRTVGIPVEVKDEPVDEAAVELLLASLISFSQEE